MFVNWYKKYVTMKITSLDKIWQCASEAMSEKLKDVLTFNDLGKLELPSGGCEGLEDCREGQELPLKYYYIVKAFRE